MFEQKDEDIRDNIKKNVELKKEKEVLFIL